MDELKDLYELRDSKPEDNNFILATFLRGLYYGDSWFSQIPKQVFMDNYKHVASKIINSPNVVIKIACLKEDANVILGYSVLSSDYQTVHWVYVKSVWRLKGIGKSLVPAYSTAATHLSDLGRKLMIKYKDMIFNPFKLN